MAVYEAQTLTLGVRMSPRETHSRIVARRAELMAELFLQEFGPVFLSRPTTPDVGYDLLGGFPNEKGGINTFAVQVKAIEEPPGGRIQISRRTFDRFAHSNVPGLLLVADAKHNRLYYAWLRTGETKPGATRVSVAITPVDAEATRELRREFERAVGDLAAVS